MATIAEQLLACGAVKFGDFTLTSGAKSPYYIDVKAASTDPTTLKAIAHKMAQLAARNGPFHAVAGMELGAVPIATAVSLEANLPMLIIRKGERKHGTGKRIEGRETKGLRVMVVEDVTTSGKSTLEAVEVLRAAGATVAYACVVVDREAGAIKALADAKVQRDALATVSQLLDTTDARRILGAAGAGKAAPRAKA